MSPEQIEVERKAFEAWYVVNAFDYARDPIGSKLCGDQWAAWLARAEKAQRVRAQLQFAVDILSRIPALGRSAQVDAMRAALKD